MPDFTNTAPAGITIIGATMTDTAPTGITVTGATMENTAPAGITVSSAVGNVQLGPNGALFASTWTSSSGDSITSFTAAWPGILEVVGTPVSGLQCTVNGGDPILAANWGSIGVIAKGATIALRIVGSTALVGQLVGNNAEFHQAPQANTV